MTFETIKTMSEDFKPGLTERFSDNDFRSAKLGNESSTIPDSMIRDSTVRDSDNGWRGDDWKDDRWQNRHWNDEPIRRFDRVFQFLHRGLDRTQEVLESSTAQALQFFDGWMLQFVAGVTAGVLLLYGVFWLISKALGF